MVETVETSRQAANIGPATDGPATADQISSAAAADHRAMSAHLDQWLIEHDVEGALIGIGFPDDSIAIVVAGTDSDGDKPNVGETFFATSVTKTLTAAIILDLASQGRLDLDAPVPELASIPDFPHAGRVTPRQLLQHTAGLVPYQRASNWNGKCVSPAEAITLVGQDGLEWTPGSDKGYSNSGYIYLGLIAEELTGRPYAELVADMTDAAGMRASTIDDADRPGWVGYSAGGLVSNVEDLVRWGAALYRDDRIVAPSVLASMLDVNNEHSTGLGANPVCPCGTYDDGRRWYTSIGHDGGSVTLQFSPSSDLVIAAKFTESFWTDELNQLAIHSLLQDLRFIATDTGPTAPVTPESAQDALETMGAS